MDFHSLLRRDLQFLCKINKIPANMTNIAMADALKSLETVEGLDEYMNQSPTTVAKMQPSTAARTTRRKTAVKPEPQSSRLTSKSLVGEVDQEDMNRNVALESKVEFEAKTPAARSTRKVSAAAAADSCRSKVQESKKAELVQSAYSTRRSTRLLEKCMADLSLKTKETLDKPEKIEETEQEVSIEKKNLAGSEEKIEVVEVILGRDLSASMEKEWDVLKNDNDVPLLEHTNTETTNDNKESKNFEIFESSIQVHHQLAEEAIQENVSEHDEETIGEQTDGGSNSEAEREKDNSSVDSNQADHQETKEATIENDSEAEKITTLDEDTMVESDGDSESEQEGDDSGSNQCVQGTAPTSVLVAEEALVETAPPFVAESVSAQFPRPNKSASKNSAMKLINVDDTSKENNMEMMMMMNVVKGESKAAEAAKKNKVEINEENLNDVSMRRLVKMVKELSIKSSNNRTALQILPGNNQTAE